MLAWGLGLVLIPASCDAAPYRETFELRDPTWKVDIVSGRVDPLHQSRSESAGRTGRGELLQFVASADETLVRLRHALPAARALDELTAGLWVWSDQPVWTLSVTLVVPGYRDPETKQPLRITLRGRDALEPERWGLLRCRTSEADVKQKQVLLRAKHPNLVDFGTIYVDELVLEGRLPAGTTTLRLDDLEFGPIVPPDPQVLAGEPLPASTGTEFRDERPPVPAVEFRLDRLLVDGRSFVPRMVRHHGEPPELLRDLGFNVVWIPDAADTRLITKLWQHGLWVTAEPPRPRDVNGRPLTAGTAGLVPFTSEVDPVLFWLLGQRVPGTQVAELHQWIEQIEFADRARKRPIAVDVAFGERDYSREVDLLGISRPPLQTSLTLRDYRLWLQDRRALARPGTFCWTWLQTTANPELRNLWRAADVDGEVDPEQLRLQAYAALAAGCRGFGFWTEESLAGTTPADEERRLAIRRVNLELKLLEPWLATAGGTQEIACVVDDAAATADSRNIPFGLDRLTAGEREARLRARASDLRQRQGRDREFTAFSLRGEPGQLVIPLWLDAASQFVPAHAAVSNVRLVIPGTEQTATALEFSPTQLRSLKAERVTGGLQVVVPTVDQLSYVWLTSDLALVERMRQRIAAIQTESAEVLVKLARLKLDRVGLVDQALQGLAPQQPDGPQKLGRAKLRLERAADALENDDPAAAAAAASEVLQLLRLLERDHWDAAVQHLSSPVSSPYTLCYQTLPAHWRMIAALGTGRERGAKNLLPSGEFEDYDTLVAEGWGNVHHERDSLLTSAALFPTGRKGKYALRLECLRQPGGAALDVLDEPAVTVTTPPMGVAAGQLLLISGWVRIAQPIVGSRDGLMIYDSLLKRSGALRLYDGDQWRRFELLRVAPQSGEVTLTLSLTGIGTALVDDLQVMVLEPRNTISPDEPDGPIQQTSGGSLLERLPKFPRFTPRRDDP